MQTINSEFVAIHADVASTTDLNTPDTKLWYGMAMRVVGDRHTYTKATTPSAISRNLESQHPTPLAHALNPAASLDVTPTAPTSRLVLLSGYSAVRCDRTNTVIYCPSINGAGIIGVNCARSVATFFTYSSFIKWITWSLVPMIQICALLSPWCDRTKALISELMGFCLANACCRGNALGTWLTQPLVSIREALDNHQSLAPASARSQVSWLVSASTLLISAQNPKRAFNLSPESDSGIAKNKPTSQRKQVFLSTFCDATPPSSIQRTLHPASTPVQHMGINHRRLHVLMPKQFLDRANVIPAL